MARTLKAVPLLGSAVSGAGAGLMVAALMEVLRAPEGDVFGLPALAALFVGLALLIGANLLPSKPLEKGDEFRFWAESIALMAAGVGLVLACHGVGLTLSAGAAAGLSSLPVLIGGLAIVALVGALDWLGRVNERRAQRKQQHG
ncbi:MAG: hypothetical protein GC206_14725 [Alphaproteobacteria bacterium]|nr:hypothetical protein [Alphaproteobacteria bacterium]